MLNNAGDATVLTAVGEARAYFTVTLAFLMFSLVPLLTVIASKHHVRARSFLLERDSWPRAPELLKVEHVIEEEDNYLVLRIYLWDIPFVRLLTFLLFICALWAVYYLAVGGVYYLPSVALLGVAVGVFTIEKGIRENVERFSGKVNEKRMAVSIAALDKGTKSSGRSISKGS